MYNANASYEQNYALGPQTQFNASGVLPQLEYLGAPRFDFLGVPLFLPFGIPAGPLLNARYVKAALNAGFCMPVYKTVRSCAWPSHPYPNVLNVFNVTHEPVMSNGVGASTEQHAAESVQLLSNQGNACVLARPFREQDYLSPQNLSISNSFGVPSQPPEVWAADFGSLIREPEAFSKGNILVLSFQGTRLALPSQNSSELSAQTSNASADGGFDGFLEDTCRAAVLARRAFGACKTVFLEINLSCPNEDGQPVFHDIRASTAILRAVKSTLRSLEHSVKEPCFEIGAKIIVKLGRMPFAKMLEFLESTAPYIDAVSCINTLPARILDSSGKPALGAQRPTSGICGKMILQESLAAMKELSRARNLLRLDTHQLGLVGVGGVSCIEDFLLMKEAGADVVQAATGAMWNLELASQIARELKVPFRSVLGNR